MGKGNAKGEAARRRDQSLRDKRAALANLADPWAAYLSGKGRPLAPAKGTPNPWANYRPTGGGPANPWANYRPGVARAPPKGKGRGMNKGKGKGKARQAKSAPAGFRQQKGRGKGSSGGRRQGPTYAPFLSLHRPLGSPTPTRIEVMTFSARFTLPTATSAYLPLIVFSPGRSIVHAVVFRPRATDVFGTMTKSGVSDSTLVANWVNGNTVQTTNGVLAGVTDSTVIANSSMAGEAVGHPNTLLSNMVRVIGGTCHISVGCGPTGRGRVLSRVLNLNDTLKNNQEIKDMMVFDADRPALVGCLDFQKNKTVHGHFTAPLANDNALVPFGIIEPTFTWSGASPFYPVALAFDNVDYCATSDLPPYVVFSYRVSVECQLDTRMHHHANPGVNGPDMTLLQRAQDVGNKVLGSTGEFINGAVGNAIGKVGAALHGELGWSDAASVLATVVPMAMRML